MTECTEQIFKQLLATFQDDPGSGLTGPFIHAAPVGNMFRGPFREQAWMVGKTVVLKKIWAPETDWRFFIDASQSGLR